MDGLRQQQTALARVGSLQTEIRSWVSEYKTRLLSTIMQILMWLTHH